ncbi:MAG: hypothetical protein CMF42_02240 [Legionellales bacterium]|nr:hypothetical protein [Legionellales bacterium]
MWMVSRKALILFLALINSGCTQVVNKNTSACDIFTKNFHWYRAVSKNEKKYGIPKSTTLAIIAEESNFNVHAKQKLSYLFGFIPWERQSSAIGYGQILNGGWNDYKKANKRMYASRKSFSDTVDYIGWYLDKASKRLHIKKTDTASLYLAYHDGIEGYRRSHRHLTKYQRFILNKVQKRQEQYEIQSKQCEQSLNFWNHFYFWSR